VPLFPANATKEPVAPAVLQIATLLAEQVAQEIIAEERARAAAEASR
jgi:hypothetical protein